MATKAKVRERPILFSGEMVRAILDGTKTQTRRVVKDLPAEWTPKPPMESISVRDGILYVESQSHVDDSLTVEMKCPYGKPGMRLWVRETWQQVYPVGSWNRLAIAERPVQNIPKYRLLYAATHNEEEPPRWRPSIHMPRWASRINLLIKDVRVERIQDISEEDAIAEGIACARCKGRGWYLKRFADNQGVPCADCLEKAAQAGVALQAGQYPKPNNVHIFSDLWDSINQKRGHGWDQNDPVWVVDFERLEAGS